MLSYSNAELELHTELTQNFSWS